MIPLAGVMHRLFAEIRCNVARIWFRGAARLWFPGQGRFFSPGVFLFAAKGLPDGDAGQGQEAENRPVGQCQANKGPVFLCAKSGDHEHGGPFH